MPPGTSCTVSVLFAPASSGAKAASLALSDNAANAPQTVALAGTGAIPNLVLSASSLQFGTQALATIPAPQPVTITNSGAVPLNNLSLSITGANAADFAQTGTCGATLAANASCTANITFNPSIAATEQASLTIAGANVTTQTVCSDRRRSSAPALPSLLRLERPPQVRSHPANPQLTTSR